MGGLARCMELVLGLALEVGPDLELRWCIAFNLLRVLKNCCRESILDTLENFRNKIGTFLVVLCFFECEVANRARFSVRSAKESFEVVPSLLEATARFPGKDRLFKALSAIEDNEGFSDNLAFSKRGIAKVSVVSKVVQGIEDDINGLAQGIGHARNSFLAFLEHLFSHISIGVSQVIKDIVHRHVYAVGGTITESR